MATLNSTKRQIGQYDYDTLVFVTLLRDVSKAFQDKSGNSNFEPRLSRFVKGVCDGEYSCWHGVRTSPEVGAFVRVLVEHHADTVMAQKTHRHTMKKVNEWFTVFCQGVKVGQSTR